MECRIAIKYNTLNCMYVKLDSLCSLSRSKVPADFIRITSRCDLVNIVNKTSQAYSTVGQSYYLPRTVMVLYLLSKTCYLAKKATF